MTAVVAIIDPFKPSRRTATEEFTQALGHARGVVLRSGATSLFVYAKAERHQVERQEADLAECVRWLVSIR